MFLIHILLLFSVVNILLCCENHVRNWISLRSPHVAVLILARGGSKGIKLKNVSIIGNLSLLQISLKELNNVIGVDSTWVSTDHELIMKNIEKNVLNIHWRSPDSATDTASSLEAVQEFLQHHREIDVLGLVQCTSPFVKSLYLQQGLNAVRNGKECSFSASRSYKLRWRRESDRVVPVNFDPSNRPRRQDFQHEFIENGMFYFASTNLIWSGSFQSKK